MRRRCFAMLLAVVMGFGIGGSTEKICFAKSGIKAGNTAVAQKEQPLEKTTTMQLNVQVASGAGVYQYRFVLVRDGKQIENTNWIDQGAYDWTPTKAGLYKVYAAVRDKNHTERLVHGRTFTFHIEKKLKISALKVKRQGENIQIVADTSGGTGEKSYYFYGTDKKGRKIAISKSYTNQNKVVKKDSASKIKKVFVNVKDADGTLLKKGERVLK